MPWQPCEMGVANYCRLEQPRPPRGVKNTAAAVVELALSLSLVCLCNRRQGGEHASWEAGNNGVGTVQC